MSFILSRLKLAFFALFFMLTSIGAIAQGKTTDTLETRIKNSLSQYYRSYPVETLYIHTNQNVYAVGQTIWYKMYASVYGKPSQLSKIAYVQLADNVGKVVAKNRIPLVDSRGNGNIDIDKTLPTGWYQLRGYTAWMLNFDKGGFFRQEIYIRNAADTARHAAGNVTYAKPRITFFPEGGDMIDGITCNVAFKATDGGGLPLSVDGDVLDNTTAIVAKLINIHDGMGTFRLEGRANRTYSVRVRFPDNTVRSFALPPVKAAGMSLEVGAQNGANIELKITCAGKPDQFKNTMLMAFQNNGKIATYPLVLARGINVFNIEKKNFLTGTLRLTLFDQAGIPQAERLLFIDNNDPLKLKLDADTLSYQPSGKAVFTLHATDGADKPLEGNFSVAVVDADAFENDEMPAHIKSSLLLTSELRGDIHDPNYYFSNNSDSLHQQLDLVMLTNGWRHFKWEKVFDKAPAKLPLPAESDLFMAGEIKNYHAADSLKIKLIIANSDSSKFVGYISPDTTGSFIMNDYHYQGAAKIYIEAVDAENKKQTVEVSFFRSLADTIKLQGDTIRNADVPDISNELLAAENGQVSPEGAILLKTVDVNTFEGYSITREFSSPDHSKPGSGLAPDARLTLYWNPNLNTDGNGQATFHFNNNDKTKRYRLIIQGTDAEGRLGYLSGSEFTELKN